MEKFDNLPLEYSSKVCIDQHKPPVIPYFTRTSPRVITLRWEWESLLGPSTVSIRKPLGSVLRPILGSVYDKYLQGFLTHMTTTKVVAIKCINTSQRVFYVAECHILISTGVYHGFSLAACMFESNDKLAKESPLRDVYDFEHAKAIGVFCSSNAVSIGGMFRVMFVTPKKVSVPLSLEMLMTVLKYSDLDKVDVGDQLRLLRAIKRESERESERERKDEKVQEEVGMEEREDIPEEKEEKNV
jgi:hypothetical protein